MRHTHQKPKTVDDDLRSRLKKCVTQADREKVIKQLVADSLSKSFKVRDESRKLLFAYLYGEPSQRQHVSHVGVIALK